MATLQQFLDWHNYYVASDCKRFQLINDWLEYCEASKLSPKIVKEQAK